MLQSPNEDRVVRKPSGDLFTKTETGYKCNYCGTWSRSGTDHAKECPNLIIELARNTGDEKLEKVALGWYNKMPEPPMKGYRSIYGTLDERLIALEQGLKEVRDEIAKLKTLIK